MQDKKKNKGKAVLLSTALIAASGICSGCGGKAANTTAQSTEAKTEAAAKPTTETKNVGTTTEGKAEHTGATTEAKAEKAGTGAKAEDRQVTIDPDRNYLKPDGTVYANEVFDYEGILLYAGSDGTLAGGPHRRDGKLLFFDENGVQVTEEGWNEFNGKKYYVSEASTVMCNGRKIIHGKNYFFGKTGELRKGRIDIDEGSFYFTDSDGAILTDFEFTLDNVRYYADTEGIVLVGSMYSKAQEYYSDTDYLILVNLTTQKTAVYQGKKGEWHLLREMLCASGAPINPTPKGEYETTSKCLHFDNHGMRAWYSTGFIGGLYLIHSLPYEIDSEPRVCVEPELGRANSHGCVRVALEDAKWIYDLIPQSTKVVIYED